jgi:hypothetical protein
MAHLLQILINNFSVASQSDLGLDIEVGMLGPIRLRLPVCNLRKPFHIYEKVF